MHGIIHAELRRFVETTHGVDAWGAVLAEAGLDRKIYLSTSTYPDAEAVAIVTAANKLTGIPASKLLEDFGEFIAPTLLSMFKPLIKPTWKTLEMLLNTEETIHKVVRMRNPGAEPPRLHFEPAGPGQLLFRYNSPRKMASVAKGIIRGVARHYGETVDIAERPEVRGVTEMLITVR
ncbi:MAG: heme NO-binding domain-containing protein [Terriglobales bacterium]